MKARIAGIGSYVPDRVLTNSDFEKMVDTSDEWIRTRSGIRERHVIADDQATSDLALIAGKRALSSAQVKPREIGAIIVATATPDMLFPSTACLVQAQIGAPRVISFDISAGCTGFLYGLAVAESFVVSGYDNVLLIGADTLTRITDYQDRTTCVLFGDGAGAVMLKRSEGEGGIVSSFFAADGSSADEPSDGNLPGLGQTCLSDV